MRYVFDLGWWEFPEVHQHSSHQLQCQEPTKSCSNSRTMCDEPLSLVVCRQTQDRHCQHLKCVGEYIFKHHFLGRAIDSSNFAKIGVSRNLSPLKQKSALLNEQLGGKPSIAHGTPVASS